MEKKKGAIFNLFTIAFIYFLTVTSFHLYSALTDNSRLNWENTEKLK